MKLMTLSSALFVSAILGLGSDAHAQVQCQPPLKSGGNRYIYKIVNENSGKVLDVAFNSTESSYRLLQWEYLNLLSQQWYFLEGANGGYRIVNRNSEHHIEPAGLNNGAKIWQVYYNLVPQQTWFLYCDPNDTSRFLISNNLTSRVIDVEHNSTGNGAYIHQWDYVSGVRSQWWRFVRIF
ncbi:RICIN domain-containing protein [Myxococcus stipitatus]|uniref:RICIN domain-containing protein n=1 Tax=Myxococcus stipitatus TaxID=83455 RepID=UPI0030D45260